MMYSVKESVIFNALAKISGVTAGASLQQLARSIAKSVSYDPGLNAMTDDELASAVMHSGGKMEHSAVMAKIREYREKAAARSEELRNGPEPPSTETVNRGFFLRCWDAYRRDGDLSDLRYLTVSFLARWLLAEKKYIDDVEADWCARRAVEAAEPFDDLTAQAKEARQEAAFQEAVVLLVMNKFERALTKDRQKTQALLNGWRDEYTEYTVRQFGNEPDWSPTGANRQPAINLFKKKAS